MPKVSGHADGRRAAHFLEPSSCTACQRQMGPPRSTLCSALFLTVAPSLSPVPNLPSTIYAHLLLLSSAAGSRQASCARRYACWPGRATPLRPRPCSSGEAHRHRWAFLAGLMQVHAMPLATHALSSRWTCPHAPAVSDLG